MEMVQAAFQGAWQLFTLQVPGIDVSFGVLAVGFFLMSIAIRILFGILGLGSSAAPSSYDIIKYSRRDR